MGIRHNIKDSHLLDKYGRIKGTRGLFVEDKATEKAKTEAETKVRENLRKLRYFKK